MTARLGNRLTSQFAGWLQAKASDCEVKLSNSPPHATGTFVS